MDKIQFKTNLKCAGCIAAVKPMLDKKAGEGKWQVDLSDPQRILTIEAQIEEEEVKALLAKAGYTAEKC